MTQITDLAYLAKLTTHFSEDRLYTRHVYKTSRPGQRTVEWEERWKREPRILGSGGFGTVYLETCMHSDNDKQGKHRAVKVLKRSKGVRYERELEAVAFFSHEKYRQCFVESYGWFDTAEEIFIAMEYLPNRDLQLYLDVHHSIPEQQTKFIVSQVTEALQYMHAHHFTHRDLKPANIMIVEKGPAWWIKVADFGISKREAKGAASSRTLAGTWEFMAPEILEPFWKGTPDSDVDISYTNAVDVWATGVIAYLLLTGELPFPRPLSQELQQYFVGRSEFPTSAWVVTDLSKEAFDFAARLLAPKPQDRPSVSACKDDIWLQEQQSTRSMPSGISAQDTLKSGSQPSATWESGHWPLQTTSATSQASVEAKVTHQVPWPTNRGNQDSGMAMSQTSDQHYRHDAPAEALPGQAPYTSSHLTAHDLDSTAGAKISLDKSTAWTLDSEVQKVSISAALACSPDGKFVATSSGPRSPDPSSLIIWDTVSWLPVSELIGSRGTVSEIAWSPDGRYVAAGSLSTATFPMYWRIPSHGDIPNRLECHNLRHGPFTRALAFSHDSKLLAFASRSSIIVQDMVEMTIVSKTKVDSRWDRFKDEWGGYWISSLVSTLAFAPDGQILASGHAKKRAVTLWNPKTMSIIGTLDGRGSSSDIGVHGLAFSKNGNILASTDGRLVRTWNMTNRHPLGIFESQRSGYFEGVAFGPYGLVAYGTENVGCLIFRDASKLDQPVAKLPSKPIHVSHVALLQGGVIVTLGRTYNAYPPHYTFSIQVWRPTEQSVGNRSLGYEDR